MKLARTAIVVCCASAVLGVGAWVLSHDVGAREDEKIIAADDLSIIPLKDDEAPPRIDIASIPQGTVAVYATNGDWLQYHFFQEMEDGLYPVERRNIGDGRDDFVGRDYYDAAGVVRLQETERGRSALPDGRCEAAIGVCRYKIENLTQNRRGGVMLNTDIAEDGGSYRQIVHLGAGSLLITASVSDKWGIRKSEERIAANGSYSKIDLLEIRLP